MGGFGSGGTNRLTAEEHIVRGTFRRDRHGPQPTPPPAPPVSGADRRRLLRGLSAEARRIVIALLESYDGWDASSLSTLRAYGQSCARVVSLEAVGGPDLHRELRVNVMLRKSLGLERNK